MYRQTGPQPHERFNTSLVERRRDAFGWAVRCHREELDLSRGEVARLAGLDRAQVFAIELGRLSPSLDQGQALAAALETDLAELLHEARAIANPDVGVLRASPTAG
jgi:DNA-binding XRE family transcriptional regulator